MLAVPFQSVAGRAAILSYLPGKDSMVERWRVVGVTLPFGAAVAPSFQSEPEPSSLDSWMRVLIGAVAALAGYCVGADFAVRQTRVVGVTGNDD